MSASKPRQRIFSAKQFKPFNDQSMSFDNIVMSFDNKQISYDKLQMSYDNKQNSFDKLQISFSNKQMSFDKKLNPFDNKQNFHCLILIWLVILPDAFLNNRKKFFTMLCGFADFLRID